MGTIVLCHKRRNNGKYTHRPVCGAAHAGHYDTQWRRAWGALLTAHGDRLLKELIVAFGLLPVEYDEQGADGRLVAVLLDRLAQAKPADLMLPWPATPYLVELCHYLATNADCRLPLAHFSAQLGVSDKTLSRAFKRDTGMSFRQWRQRSRLLSALPLLEAGERVTDVALACGYDSLSAFIAAFKALLGSSPGEHLKS